MTDAKSDEYLKVKKFSAVLVLVNLLNDREEQGLRL